MYLTKNIAKVTLICGSVDGRQQIRMGAGQTLFCVEAKNLQYEIWCDFFVFGIYNFLESTNCNLQYISTNYWKVRFSNSIPEIHSFAFKLLLPVVLITINYTR